MINNISIKDYQENADLTYLLVEPKTGVTSKMFKNYQVKFEFYQNSVNLNFLKYNIQLRQNILLNGKLISKEQHYPVLLETTNMEFNGDRVI